PRRQPRRQGPRPQEGLLLRQQRPLADREDHLPVTDPDFTIRLATSADREAITRLFDTANPAWATSAAQYRAGPRPEPTNGLAVVAEDDSRIVGAGRANEALEGLLPQPGTFSARVAVDPGAAGDGVGSVLWRAASDWLSEQ